MVEGDLEVWMILANPIEFLVDVLRIRNDDEEMLLVDAASHRWQ